MENPRWATSSRGATILAALVFALILAGVTASIEYGLPQDRVAMTAAGAAATGGAATAAPPLPPVRPADASKADPSTQACSAAVSQAKSGKDTTKGTTTLKDSCITAIKVQQGDPQYDYYQKLNGGYKCVGKDMRVGVNMDGTLTAVWNADPSVAAGTCKVAACQASYVGSLPLSHSAGKCVAANLNGVDKTSILSALSSSDARTVISTGCTSGVASYLVGSGCVGLANPLSSWPDQTLLNQALARDPNNTSGLIPLSNSGQIASSPDAYNQIQQYVNGGGYQSDPNALSTQQQVTNDVCQANPGLCNSQTTLPPICNGSNAASCTPPPPGCPSCASPNPTVPNQYPTSGSTFGGSGSASGLTSFLSGLMRGFMQPQPQVPQQAPAQQCPTDPTAYNQYQQTYQQQLQQYNYQLQQYQYQQQMQQYYAQQGNYSYGYAQTPPPIQPTPCTPAAQNQCATQPQQPPASQCTVGTWQPVTAQNGVCTVGWNCVPGNGNNQTPTAALSCEPKTADVGMTLAVSFACSTGTATSTGFDTGGQQSGSVSVTVQKPPQGTNTATYVLTCNNNGQTAGANCSIQVSQPTIMLVANPSTVAAGGISQIGWITTGMQSCVISSPDQGDFTAQNASNTSVNGTAQTSPVSGSATFTLACTTAAGGSKSSSVVVRSQ